MRGSACSVITEPTPQLGGKEKADTHEIHAVSESYCQPNLVYTSLRVCGL